MQDLDQQWRELSERYEQMTDEEIQQLANEGYDLTDMAKELLQGEIARRNLKIKVLTEPPTVTAAASAPIAENADFDPEELDLVNMSSVWDIEDARRTKAILDGHGVPSYYGPDNVEDIEALGPAFAVAATKAARRGYEVGIDVRVPRRYRDQAARALANSAADQPPDSPEKVEEADYIALCPKCHSPEIVFEGLDGAAPEIADASFKWHCDTCGHSWNDDGVEEERTA